MTSSVANVPDTTRTPARRPDPKGEAIEGSPLPWERGRGEGPICQPISESSVRTTATHDVSKEEGATAMMFTCATPKCTDPRHDHLGAPLSRDAPMPRGAL